MLVKYDRVLAWVYVDGDLLQKELVSKGYAQVKYVYDEYLFSEELKELEVEAKEKKLGMWSDVSIKKDSDFEIPSLHDLLIYGSILLFLAIIFLLKIVFKKK